MRKKINAVLMATLDHCFETGLLSKTPVPDYVIEIPNNPDHGHFATNLPLTLASTQKRRPSEIASTIVDHIKDDENLLEKAEVAGPGFINFRIRPEKWHGILSDIVLSKENYGRNDLGQGEKIIVEYISANPTGPLHVGHGRGAALGDTLCRILSVCGYDVVREFYINDAGLQIRLLGESIFSRFKQESDSEYPFPENGYHGDYVLDLARTISQKIDLNDIPEEQAIEICTEKGKAMMLEQIKHNLAEFGIEFDVWYSESDLYSSGRLQEVLDAMKAKGELYQSGGALWIKTSDFGDDKDRVIRKNDGQFTYFAADISYHLNKYKRGFTRAINIWGADHHGYVPRVKAALAAHGIPDDWLSVMLIQLVKLWEGGKEIKMSKRSGNFVTLKELGDEVGVDAVRFVFLTKNHESPLDFDIDLVKKQDSENPVYYVQYAHARICSIFRKAAEKGISLRDQEQVSPEPLALDAEMALIRRMAEFPSLLEDICRTLEPHRLTYYLTDLSASFHRYFNLGTKYPDHRIVTDDMGLSRARLLLAKAVRLVIAKGLDLLGISAPEKM
ncbi:MAG: arginine--tRNA ligase [Thermodesulfobacteriota bacterium]|nr:arginine--tRNA ligase [Thermodesulfobacteriota bacterium]